METLVEVTEAFSAKKGGLLGDIADVLLLVLDLHDEENCTKAVTGLGSKHATESRSTIARDHDRVHDSIDFDAGKDRSGA